MLVGVCVVDGNSKADALLQRKSRSQEKVFFIGFLLYCKDGDEMNGLCLDTNFLW